MFSGLFGKRHKSAATAEDFVRNLENNLESFHEPVLIIDIGMKVKYANMLARKFTDTDSAEWRGSIEGIHVNELLQKDIERHHVTIRALNAGTIQSEEIQLKFGGRLLEFIYNCIPYYYGSGTSGAILLLTDISHLRHLQRSVKKLIENS